MGRLHYDSTTSNAVADGENGCRNRDDINDEDDDDFDKLQLSYAHLHRYPYSNATLVELS